MGANSAALVLCSGVSSQRHVRVAGNVTSGVYLLQVLDAHGRMGVHGVIK